MTSIWFDAHPPTAPTSEFVPGAQVDTIVVGAGLTGLTTATLLARSGQRVALLEARRVGAVTTGHTTAKLSLLQGSVFPGFSSITPSRCCRPMSRPTGKARPG